MSKVKLFFSGTTGGSDEMKQRLARAFTHRLCSCHDAYVKEAKIWADLCKIEGATIQEMMLEKKSLTLDIRIYSPLCQYSKVGQKGMPPLGVNCPSTFK